MKFTIFCLLFVTFFAVSVKSIDIDVMIEAVTDIGRTDDHFICATMDWWPQNKCDYDQCSWGQAGLLTIDLSNQILQNAIKAFSPLRIRAGGSLEDQIHYMVGNSMMNCSTNFARDNNSLFGFTQACLSMDRWDQLNDLFNKTNAKITFGLNALKGRTQNSTNKKVWEGDWDSSNAQEFMKYSISKGYKIDSYELGNELSGSGVAAKVLVEQYAQDMISLKQVVKKLYPDQNTQPKILGPAGFFDQTWFSKFLELSGKDVVDGMTQHIYNLGAGVDNDVIEKMQDPFYLDRFAKTFKDMSDTVHKFGPWSTAWVSESGGAYNSGAKDVSNTFANGFWYVDQLGMSASFDNKVYCRQALIGGNYGLLDTTTFVPNPDYYSALLWHRLMGKNVLKVTHNSSPFVRIYAHCSKKSSGIALALINLSNSASFDVNIFDVYKYHQHVTYYGDGPKREEYHLTPENGDIKSHVVLLNGKPLKLTNSKDIPAMNPKFVDTSFPIHIESDSITFVTIKDFKAPVCA